MELLYMLGFFLFTFSSRNPLDLQNIEDRVANCQVSHYVLESPPKYEEITNPNPPLYEKAIQYEKLPTINLHVDTTERALCDNSESNVLINVDNENEIYEKISWWKSPKLCLSFFVLITLYNIIVVFIMIIYNYFWPEFILPMFLSSVFFEIIGCYWYFREKYET